MSENHVRIRYIGKWEGGKRDNIIRGSTRFWPHIGSSLRIPESQAALYLKHTDEFELETTEHVASAVAAGIASPEQIASLVDLVPFLKYEDLTRLRDAINAQLKRLKDAPPPAPAEEPLDEASANIAAERLRMITRALNEMDPRNETDYTPGGLRPKIQRVRELSGVKDATSKEVEAALSTLSPT